MAVVVAGHGVGNIKDDDKKRKTHANYEQTTPNCADYHRRNSVEESSSRLVSDLRSLGL